MDVIDCGQPVSPHSQNCAIDIQHLSLEFRSSSKRAIPVLHSVDFSVRPGEFVALVGPSGCGKTSLLRIIGGLLDGSDNCAHIGGRILVNRLPPAAAKRDRLFGFAFQNPVLLPWRTVLANVALPLEISGTAAPMSSDRVTALLDLMQVRDFSKAYPHELSGGMQQRVNIARSLVHDPRVLLMDEPFGSLDEVTRENLNLALLRIHRLKRPTVVFVTHSLREAAFLADRVIVLTHRPATVKAIITTTLPQQRGDGIQMEAPFIELLAEIRERFFESEGAGD